jgi:CRISPR-associated endonuclease Cas2
MASGKKIFRYKGAQVNIFGIPTSSNSRRVPKEKRVRNLYSVSFSSPFKKDSPKNLIVMYDIPHEKKKERDWFRRHLIKFGYVMIQKSVWVGPSPLPKTFSKYVKDIGLNDKLMTFKLAKTYINKESGL